MQRQLLPILLLLSHVALGQTSAVDSTGSFACDEMAVGSPVEFEGHRLVEIPDITSSELRLANLQLSSGCRGTVAALLEAYLDEQPDDPEVIYVLARYVWITYGTAAGEQIVLELTNAFPEFTSGWVLLAGVYIDQRRYDESEAVLDRIEAQQPDDMWIFLNRMRLEVTSAPSDAIRQRLLAIFGDDRFPPNVRSQAGYEVRTSRGATLDQVEAVYRGELEFRSGLPFGCKLANLAWWLMDRRQQWDEGKQVIEAHMGEDIDCPGGTGARDFLAYAYLVEAAQLAPLPSPLNAAYIARADETIQGDYEGLARFLDGHPRREMLWPFIAPKLHADAAPY